MGNRKTFLAAACREIATRCGVIRQQSSLYETDAWGMEKQEAFVNQALVVQTGLEAGGLLQTLLQIEETLGRKRSVKYGPRTIDIDVLFFNEDVVEREELTIPHPQVQHRRFALAPLAEVAPELVHPVLQKTIAQLLAECPDPLSVQKIS